MTEKNETGWIIETAANQWWTGEGNGTDAEFSSDPRDAVRFARAEDALKVMLKQMRGISHLLRATEHSWVSK